MTADVDYESARVYDDHIYGNQEPDDHIYGNQEPDDHIYGNQEPVGRPLHVSELETYISETSGWAEGFAEEFSASNQQMPLSCDTALQICTEQMHMQKHIVRLLNM